MKRKNALYFNFNFCILKRKSNNHSFFVFQYPFQNGKSNYQIRTRTPTWAQFKDVNDADLKAMDSQISELSAEVQSLTQTCRQLDAELKELNSSLTTEEMVARLEKIKSATNHVTPEEKEKVYKERDVYVKEWRKRKRLASDMINAILEGYPKSKKEFLDEAGVETDEDCKVAVPST
uniref:PSMC3 interacting protein n=1 Tax=Amphiprion percula TaxID=161767 RepID=A0A3P8TI13_AMPPE